MGGKKESTTPDDDDEAPPRLCSGPGPATGERGYERKKWEAEGEKAGRRVCPAGTHACQCCSQLADAHPAMLRGRGETNGREEGECVEGEEFVLTLEKTEGGLLAVDVWGTQSEARAHSIHFRERYCLL